MDCAAFLGLYIKFMATPFLSEIRIMSFGFPPKGWAQCNGQLLPINQNQALFSLLGTTFGGNGQTTFGLPDFRGRVPIHVGNSHVLGEKAGEEAHTVTVNELPQHIHFLSATSAPASQNVPLNAVLGSVNNGYTASANLTALAAGSLTSVGGNQAHTNIQPYLTLNFCIALQGIFPSPT
jgi:microcystin-dependent protein